MSTLRENVSRGVDAVFLKHLKIQTQIDHYSLESFRDTDYLYRFWIGKSKAGFWILKETARAFKYF